MARAESTPAEPAPAEPMATVKTTEHPPRAASRRARLRVALLSGGLAPGGAEKQLLYVARALRAAGAEVAVYSVDRDGHYGALLRAEGLAPVWLGGPGGSLGRLVRIVRMLAAFRPHVIQATHSFMNLYAGLAGRLLGARSIGALRSSLRFCRKANGRWTPWLMSLPAGLVVNSESASREVREEGAADPTRLFVLPNAIDLSEYPSRAPRTEAGRVPVAAFVGRLIPSKRLDLFLRALAATRGAGVALRGLVIGDGPELSPGRGLAAELGLTPEDCAFLGQRPDLPELLADADMLVLCSEDEGLPNVVLEGMAAGLPIVSTPAGDAETLVHSEINGFVVPFGDVPSLAAAMERLASSPRLRIALGSAGRDLVRRRFSLDDLPARLFAIYRAMAQRDGDSELLALLPDPEPRGAGD